MVKAETNLPPRWLSVAGMFALRLALGVRRHAIDDLVQVCVACTLSLRTYRVGPFCIYIRGYTLLPGGSYAALRWRRKWRWGRMVAWCGKRGDHGGATTAGEVAQQEEESGRW